MYLETAKKKIQAIYPEKNVIYTFDFPDDNGISDISKSKLIAITPKGLYIFYNLTKKRKQKPIDLKRFNYIYKNNCIGVENVVNNNKINLAPQEKNISPDEYNKIYEQRREIALSKAQANCDKAMEIDGFNEVYSRLFVIEKESAQAEINGDNKKVLELQNESLEKRAEANKLLKTIGLTLEDLSPKYNCEKCKDTGYVGNEKCNCLRGTK